METAAGWDEAEGEERDWSVTLEGTRDYGESSRSLSLSASSWYTAGSVSQRPTTGANRTAGGRAFVRTRFRTRFNVAARDAAPASSARGPRGIHFRWTR